MNILDLVGPVVVKKIVDEILPAKNVSEFYIFITLLSIIYIIRLFISIVSHSRGQLMGNKIKFHMKNDLYKKILNMPSRFFMKISRGDLITRVTSDLEVASTLLYKGIEDLLFSLLSLVGAIIIMFNFNRILAFATLLPLPVIFYYVYHRNKELKIGYASVRRENSRLTSDIHDTLRTIFFIKDNVLEDYKLEKFSNRNREVLKAEKRNFLNISLLMSSIAFYGNLTNLIIIFVGGYLYINDKVSMGVIISFILLTGRFRIYLMKLMSLVDIYQKGMSGLDRFKEIMERDTFDVKKSPISGSIEKIVMKDMSFSYENNKIFNNFNLDITKGSKIAFVGESGIGKSTILNILKGSLLPDTGGVYIDGKNLSEISEKSYLEKIGCVDQNDHIMGETIFENISVVDKTKPYFDIERSIERAELKEIVSNLSNGKDTLLGDEGVQLSSGQKQRVALARLFLKNPEIILLDEATNTLDNITEFNIMKNILSFFSDRTIIAVAHKLDTLKDFDKIYVLGEGGIIESGNFNELLKNKDMFYKMYRGG